MKIRPEYMVKRLFALHVYIARSLTLLAARQNVVGHDVMRAVSGSRTGRTTRQKHQFIPLKKQFFHQNGTNYNPEVYSRHFTELDV